MSEDRGDALEEAKALADEMKFIVPPDEASPQSTMLEIKVYKWQLDLDAAIAAWEKERAAFQSAIHGETELRTEVQRDRGRISVKLRDLRAAVEKVEGEMRNKQGRWISAQASGDQIIAWADALKSARLGEGVS